MLPDDPPRTKFVLLTQELQATDEFKVLRSYLAQGLCPRLAFLTTFQWFTDNSASTDYVGISQSYLRAVRYIGKVCKLAFAKIGKFCKLEFAQIFILC